MAQCKRFPGRTQTPRFSWKARKEARKGLRKNQQNWLEKRAARLAS
jgi:hypothetical protein